MPNAYKKLPDSELEIMLVLWDASEPVNSAYIQERLRGKRDWALATLLSQLARLEEKGFVRCERKWKANAYTALVPKKDYLQGEGRSFLQRLYGNSLKSFVTTLYEGNAIDEDDLDELRRFLDDAARRDPS